jgi:hypothetical protein
MAGRQSSSSARYAKWFYVRSDFTACRVSRVEGLTRLRRGALRADSHLVEHLVQHQNRRGVLDEVLAEVKDGPGCTLTAFLTSSSTSSSTKPA